MMFNVPQFIDVEDKIAGPLTWKQLLWMIGMGATLLVLFNMLEPTFFFVAAVPVALFFIALAFYRPNGMPFPRLVYYGTIFMFRPKVMVWERPASGGRSMEGARHTDSSDTPRSAPKILTEEKLKNLSRMLENDEESKY